MRLNRLTATATAVVLAIGGAGITACGDDKEGPAEDAGKAIDEAGKEGSQELKEGAKETERELDDGKKD